MIKKIMGWILLIVIIVGLLAIKVIDAMVSLQISLPIAIGLTMAWISVIIGIMALLILALKWITE